MRKQIVFWSIILVLLLSLGWGALAQEVQEETGEKTVVAEVNGEPIYAEDLQEIWDALPEVYRVQFPGGVKDILEQLIRETLLVQRAQELGLENDPVVQKRLEEIKRQLLVQELIKREIVDKVEVTDEEIEEEYTSNPSLYTEPERVKAKHIMTSTKEQKKFYKNYSLAPFEEVAKENRSLLMLSREEKWLPEKGDSEPDLESPFDLAPKIQ